MSQRHKTRQSSRVPMMKPLLCRHRGGTARALTQDISREGLFLRVREYIQPGSIYAIELMLPDEPVLLRLAVSARFIGRIPTGFGIGACITERAPARRQRWEQLYDSAVQGGVGSTYEVVGERVVATADALSAAAQAHLEAHGFLILRARSNREVPPLLQPDTAEVVLCDMHDPQLSGVELCALIRRQPAFAKVAFILVTDSKRVDDFLAGLNAGAAYVIAKPFSAEYCASRVIAAARQTAPEAESDRSAPSLQQQEDSGTSFGATAQYLHAPSVLPAVVVRTIDRVSDAVFFTKLAARQRLRQYLALFSR
ncbi:MAG TPA: response regulator [Pseudomonadota bacterium]|nr:response regulator [Pseudomonadota bacterium]